MADGVRGDVGAAAYLGPMTPALSPSRAADFKQCPLLFRFRTIDKLEGPPSPAAARGTLVHAVLEHLFDLPAAERTPAAAVALLEPRWAALVEERPELEAMIDDDELLTAGGLVRRARRPSSSSGSTSRTPPGSSRPPASSTSRPRSRGSPCAATSTGLDVAPDGAMRVVDYKTGRSPSELFEAKALFQMKFYALVLWRIHGEIPRLLQLVYLGNGEVVRYSPDERDLLAIERNIRAIWDAVVRAAQTGDWRPRTSRLCDWCDFRDLCPAWGGTPPPLPEGAERDRARPGPLRRGRARRRLTTEAASSARRAGVIPARPSTCTAPAISGTGTTCGTASVGTPAATAERTPVGESSIATQSSRRHAEQPGGRAVGLGVRLAVRDLVAGDHRGEGALGQGADHGIGQRPPRHGDQRAGHPCGAQRLEQLAGARSPRHVLAHLRDDPHEQLVDDPLRATR